MSNPKANRLFRDLDFVINYWQNNKNKNFQLPGFMSNALALPAARIFLICSIVLAAGRLSTTNFYWQSRVSVSLSVTCYGAKIFGC